MGAIVDEFPRRLKENVDVKQMLETFEQVFERCIEDTKCIPDFYLNPDLIPEKFLNLKLNDWGFNLGGFELTEAQKRRLLDGLIPRIYKQKGTLLGIVNLIRLLLGIEVTAEIQSADASDAWEIGIDEIGVSTIIGIEDPASFLIITADEELTDEQVANILNLVNYMRVAGTEVILEYPNKPIEQELYWTIGVSEFGDGYFIGTSDPIYEQNYPPAGTARQDFVN